MSEGNHRLPLNNGELQALVRFARLVDQSTHARDRLSASTSLSDVITAAEDHGFADLTIELLIRASHHVQCTGWIWQRSPESWRDHLYLLSLTILIARPIQSALANAQQTNRQSAEDGSQSGIETTAAPLAQPPVGPSLAEALEVVRAHGYIPQKRDALPGWLQPPSTSERPALPEQQHSKQQD